MDRHIKFVLMRAFRIGGVTSADLMRACDVSTPTATRVMSRALEEHGELLQRVKRALVPRPLAVVPDFAGEAALLKALDGGRSNPMETGIFPHEVPVSYVSWSNTLPAKPGTLNLIIKAITNETLLNIVYLGMTKNEVPSEKTVFPLSLEKMNDQWRLIAQDIDKPGHPLRVYVLSRIFEASASFRRKPRALVRQGHEDTQKRISVKVNPALTPLQQEIIARELCVHDGHVEIASRSEFEFCRRFTNGSASENAVWPPLVLKEKY
jgi:predicted DNA-binding transcriptional regulator YafY